MRFSTIHLSQQLSNWNLMLKGLSSLGKWQEVLCHFYGMKNTGVQLIDPSVYHCILKACSKLSFSYGKSIHGELIKKGFDSYTSIGNSTMDFYMKYGYPDAVLSVFNCMSRDSVSWNIMVYGKLVQGSLGEGFWWFKKARLARFEPNTSTLVLVIQACRVLGAKHEGLKVHGYVIQGGFLAIPSVQNSLLSMYAEDDMGSARNLFDEISDRDVISWSVMIGGYVHGEEALVAIQLFRNMISEVDIEPDGLTMVSVLKACADSRNITMGTLVHKMVICRGLDYDLFVGNSLIDMYSKCSDADSAFKVFKEMPRRNNVSWNSILSGFVLNERHFEALSLFKSMGNDSIESDAVSLVSILQTCKHFVDPLQCKSVHCVMIRRGNESNEMVLNALIDAYAKCSLIELARKLFDGMKRTDVVSWSTMISGFTHCGMPDEAIAVFLEMSRAKERPNLITIINVLEACSVLAKLKTSKWAHAISIRRLLATEVAVGTAIVDMYSKCGAIEASRRAFDQILKKNVVSWSAMIAAYGMNGLAHEALSLLTEMKLHGVKPNAVTVVCVLSACSHGGLVEEGLSFFNSMVQDHGLEARLEHYSCIVDMLGRAGKLTAAMEFIKRIPQGLKAGANVWGALLSACRSHRNSEVGAEAASRVLELEPSISTGYLLASSVYAAGGLWGDAAYMRRLVKERGLKVVAGYSLVHVGDKACKFVSGDDSHSQAEDIHFMVELLHSSMKVDRSIDLVILFASLLTAEKTDQQVTLISDATFGERHSEEYCAMYNICGERSDGKALNCPYGSPSVKPGELLSAKIQSLCPTLSGNVCCSEAQFETLRSQVQQAIPFLVGCPACLRNFLNLFCELSCSPNQSLFINVTSTSQVKGNATVDGIDYYVTDTFVEGLYNSCKDVKFGTMNTRAMEFVGGGANNFKEWLEFIGAKAAPGLPGSPFLISFKSNVSKSSGMEPMSLSVYSCSDTSLGCSCGDCPLSSSCSDSEPPSPSQKESCLIKIGSLKIRCIEFTVAVLYIVLISAFFGWGLFHRTTERRRHASSMEPLLNLMHGDFDSDNLQKDESHTTKAPELVHPVNRGIQLSVVQGYISNFFRTYGKWVARNPTLVLCSSLAIVLVLCLGVVRFKVETQPEKLWVGQGSKAAEEKRFFDSHLAPFYRIEQLIIATIPDPENGKRPSIVTDDNIQLLFDIQEKVDGIRASYSGSTVSLTDICLKPLGQDCATQSILQYFKMDPDNLDVYGGVEHVEYCFQHYSSVETCLGASKAPLDPLTALGGFSGNNYSEASAFVVTYPVNNAVDEGGNENGRALVWEKDFIKLAKEELLPMVQSSNLTLSFSSESSIEEELKRESTADVITIVVSYLVMFAYVSLTLGDVPQLSSFYLSSKVLLGLSGVVLVVFSVLGSAGFFSAIGVKSTLIIMEVIPFLVLAVGVDNMCILVHAVKRQSLELPIEEKISNALVEVGPSITLASVSEILAFAVGSFIPMPACRVFSMFAALAVLLDFFLQVTAFVALIVFDLWRVEDNRIDCFPCIKVSATSMEPNDGINQRRVGLLERYMKEIHAPILGIWAVKMVVIAVFSAFTLASIALCSRIQPGLEQKVALPRDSYLQGYFNNISEYLRIGPPLYFVVKDYNYSVESRHTNKLCSISQCDSNSLLNEISRASLTPESSYIARPAASWLDDFLVWLSPEAFGCCRKFINGSYCPPDDQPPCCEPDEGACGLGGVCQDCTTCFRHSDLVNDRPSTAQFKEKLPWFLNALPSSDCAKAGHGAYTNSVNLNGYESGVIQASEFRTYHTPLNEQGDYVNSLRAAREFSSRMSDSLKMHVFPYSVFYIFFEQYLDIWRIALINIAVALGAIFVVCLLLTSSLWSTAIILLNLAMIVVDLMGVMAILDIQLNAVSVVNLIMSIGIAVEFCVHITHAYLVTHGDRSYRVKEALGTMGASVFRDVLPAFIKYGCSAMWDYSNTSPGPNPTHPRAVNVTKNSSRIISLSFPGLLFPNVPSFGSHRFFAWACILTGGAEFVGSSYEKCNCRKRRDFISNELIAELARALRKNTHNPKLAWHLFKRIFSSPSYVSSPLHLRLRSLTIIARILIDAKMHSEMDSLHQLLVSDPVEIETAHPCILSLVRILAKSGLSDKAVSHFKSLRTRFPNEPASVSLYNLLLQSSLREKDAESVSWLYKDMIVSGVSPETYTFNLLICALCDLGRVDDAREVFDKMHEKGCPPNEFSVGILVRGYCRAGHVNQGLEFFDAMRNDIFPNRIMYNTLISSFCKEGRTDEAEKLVERMRDDNIFPDVVTFNSRISALCKSGKILEASRIFRDMLIDEELGLPRPNFITYNLMLEGFCKEGMLEEAKSLFESVKKNCDFVKLESYNIWLLGLVRNRKLLEARLVLKEMLDEGLEPNIYSYNIVVDGLCKNGMIADARVVMGLMISSGILPDTVTYTTLLHGYCRKGNVLEANNVLHEMMMNNCLPNTHTCNILLHSLWKEGKTSEAEELLQKMNERGYCLDTVTCNIVINGLCNNGKLDKAIEIVDGMWTHGSAALGNLGNSFIGLVNDGNYGKDCRPDLITYSNVIRGLCMDGRVDEAKKKFMEMMGKNLHPDSVIYNNFIQTFCKQGKISSAFRVLKDMEKKGCNKNLQTYNSLILGLGSKNQIFEIYGLMNEMKERGVSPNVCTYNNVITCLCEGGRIEDATLLLDEMLQKGISPNIVSFSILIKAFCKACKFGDVQELFDIALSICGHKESLYSLMFNELLAGGEVSKAKELFEAALDRHFYVGNFLYKDLIEKLCRDGKLEDASSIIYNMINRGYDFDPASFMPVVDGLGKKGNKHEADQLAERMMEMASEDRVKNKVYRNARATFHGYQSKDGGTDWSTIVHRDDGSEIALKMLKRVQKGWGLESLSHFQTQNNEFLEY
ncbi:hypothetical protein FNV43_RR21951 [Rhamnella rubrinervis]|uniref:SSD domain-containing protein n=1 Tax=Rhamnella rubrinervis TaxID=2594499 RepID=A0A8K0DV78_9ROSA|nr:hypothetical protein FNV43_RR21951 [Rhamnella rubrinervis]